MKKIQFWTPPSSKPAPSKDPLFTKDFFSTKSFGPGHIVGLGILALGLFGVTKLFLGRGGRVAGAPALSENTRGQYGKK